MLKINPETGIPEFPKNPTLEDLQGAFELTYKNMNTWIDASYKADKIVKFFPKRQPDTIFRADVEKFKEKLLETLAPSTVKGTLQIGSVWYRWMQDCGIVPFDFNPFLPLTRKPRVYDYGPRPSTIKQKEKPSE